MDAGTAAILAAIIGLVGVTCATVGAWIGAWVESRRADRRLKDDRAWQREQLRERFMRREMQTGLRRLQKLRLRHVRATRDFYLRLITEPTSSPDPVELVTGVDPGSLGKDLIGEIEAWRSSDRDPDAMAVLVVKLVKWAEAQEEQILLENAQAALQAHNERRPNQKGADKRGSTPTPGARTGRTSAGSSAPSGAGPVAP